MKILKNTILLLIVLLIISSCKEQKKDSPVFTPNQLPDTLEQANIIQNKTVQKKLSPLCVLEKNKESTIYLMSVCREMYPENIAQIDTNHIFLYYMIWEVDNNDSANYDENLQIELYTRGTIQIIPKKNHRYYVKSQDGIHLPSYRPGGIHSDPVVDALQWKPLGYLNNLPLQKKIFDYYKEHESECCLPE